MRTYQSQPFMRKDFAEAYRLAPLADEMSLQLAASFGGKKLSGELKRLAAGKGMGSALAEAEPDEDLPTTDI